jgi:hypothetical protein
MTDDFDLHANCPPSDGKLFCGCGRLREPGSLKTIRFIGAGLLSERFRDFWESGDPEMIPRRSGSSAT